MTRKNSLYWRFAGMGPCFEFCYLLKQKKKLGKLEQYLVALGFQM